jgi:hypothetical protein
MILSTTSLLVILVPCLATHVHLSKLASTPRHASPTRKGPAAFFFLPMQGSSYFHMHTSAKITYNKQGGRVHACQVQEGRWDMAAMRPPPPTASQKIKNKNQVLDYQKQISYLVWHSQMNKKQENNYIKVIWTLWPLRLRFDFRQRRRHGRWRRGGLAGHGMQPIQPLHYSSLKISLLLLHIMQMVG